MTTGEDADTPGTLLLAPHPSSARAAREHVSDVLEAVPLPDLVDTATLLVSEVVTNAVLHAGTDIELCCRVGHASVCVEVRDRSVVTPTPRHYDESAMTGRGLGMVELLAHRWGVDTDEHGKTVWFELGEPEDRAPEAQAPEARAPEARAAEARAAEAPAAEARAAEAQIPEDRPVPEDRPLPEDQPVPEGIPAPASFSVHLQDLPVDLLLATIQYGDAVLRELVLLTIGSQEGPGPDGPALTAKLDLGPLLREVEEAQAAGRQSLDVVLTWPEGSGSAALERLALVDEADRMARDGHLLTPAAVPEVGLCRRWLHAEISRQEKGAAPTAWRMPELMDPVVGAARLPEAELRRLDTMTQGAIVADDGNRILYVNAVAAELLGWEGNDLVGQRLASIVPPDLRAAHLAGFTRYLLTGEARILGGPIRLPALRRDGSIVEVDIVIEAVHLGDRQVFRATLG